ncbi:hypothetical protein [Paraferrimonas sp. SM1919]|uniref:hypothetical protein n=1 Tax=Paraferrimonas sp. SM1919 TaxID=2662263 RepID=UPI0013D72FF1|nr:hypothetical protein [Paraferrimonas sp. SM1919]
MELKNQQHSHLLKESAFEGSILKAFYVLFLFIMSGLVYFFGFFKYEFEEVTESLLQQKSSEVFICDRKIDKDTFFVAFEQRTKFKTSGSHPTSAYQARLETNSEEFIFYLHQDSRKTELFWVYQHDNNYQSSAHYYIKSKALAALAEAFCS